MLGERLLLNVVEHVPGTNVLPPARKMGSWQVETKVQPTYVLRPTCKDKQTLEFV